MTRTIDSLNTLKALAAWDMSEAARRLFSAQDRNTDIQSKVTAMGRQSEAIASAYARAVQPGENLRLSEVTALSRQTCAALERQHDLQAILSETVREVDQERELVMAHHARVGSLQDVIKLERRALDAARDKQASAVLDELFLARRQVMGSDK